MSPVDVDVDADVAASSRLMYDSVKLNIVFSPSLPHEDGHFLVGVLFGFVFVFDVLFWLLLLAVLRLVVDVLSDEHIEFVLMFDSDDAFDEVDRLFLLRWANGASNTSFNENRPFFLCHIIRIVCFVYVQFIQQVVLLQQFGCWQWLIVVVVLVLNAG